MRLVHYAAIGLLLWVGALCAQAADPAPTPKINPNDPRDFEASQKMFERVFGDYAKLDPAKIKMIIDAAKENDLGKGEPAVGRGGRRPQRGAGQTTGTRPARPQPTPASGPTGAANPNAPRAKEGSSAINQQGKRWYFDTNNDGKPEEVWYVNIQVRAPEGAKPILVRVIDQGGDLVEGGEPDQVNDLYIVDWRADGIVDSVIEYIDTNKDGGAEQEILYWYGPTLSFFDGERMRAIVYTDLSGTHRLMHLYGYKYDQPQGQWHTPFGPDQIFHSYVFEPDRNLWVTYWENPFAFYDLDKDGSPEEAIRYSGAEGMIESYRHSFDAVNAAPADGTERHYDVSVTAVAKGGQWDTNGKARRGESSLKVDPKLSEATKLRGIPTEPVLTWEKAREQSKGVIWARTMLTWVEDGNNSDPEDKDYNERWEGVITTRVMTPEGDQEIKEKKNNFRYERSNSIFPRVGSPECGELNRRFELVENPTKPISMYYSPVDQRIHIAEASRAWMKVDFDRDGKADVVYEMDPNSEGVIDRWRVDVNGDGTFDDSWRAAGNVKVDKMEYTWKELSGRMEDVIPDVPQTLYAINVQLEKALRKAGASADDPLATLLNNSMRSENIPNKLAKKLVNSDEGLRLWLDVLKDRRIVALRAKAKDAELWEKFDKARSAGDLDAMLKALVKYNGGSAEKPARLYAEWTNKLRAKSNFQEQEVGYRFLNNKGNMAWESLTNAYRIYNGQFDLYDKYEPQLITRINWGNYHHEQPWGMDCLLLESTAGLGGVTLFVNGEPYPVRNAGETEKPGEIHFTTKVVEFTSDTVTLEFKGEGVGPKKNYTATWHVTCRGGHQESMNKFFVTGGEANDKLQLGIEMMKLPKEEGRFFVDEKKGLMTSRGFEGPEIGWVGFGLAFPADKLVKITETPSAHMAVVEFAVDEPVTYYTLCDWVFGRKYVFGPTAKDWFEEFKEESKRFAEEK